MESLTFASTLAVLAALHDVPPSREAALKARVQNLQRQPICFPPGVNTGRGKPATYDAPAIVKLILAFELMQFGLPPERTARMIIGLPSGWLANVAADAGFTIGRGEIPDGEGDHFLVFDPRGLSSLSNPSDDGSLALQSAASVRRHTLSDAIGFRDSDAVDHFQGFLTRFASINLTVLLHFAAKKMEECGIKPKDFGNALEKWGRDNNWEPALARQAASQGDRSL